MGAAVFQGEGAVCQNIEAEAPRAAHFIHGFSVYNVFYVMCYVDSLFDVHRLSYAPRFISHSPYELSSACWLNGTKLVSQ